MGVRCIVVIISFKAKRPINPAYPLEIETLGDHLRKMRLDRGLLQCDVADLLQVDTNTVTTWEMNRHQPTPKFAKSIISFLGYIPFNFEVQHLGKQLYYARLITGKTQRQVANIIGCDTSTIECFELAQRIPITRTREKIQGYIDSSLDC